MIASARALYTRWRRRRLYRRCLRAPSGAIVLRYHSVAPPARAREYLDPGLSIPPERFREQVSALARRRRVVDLDTLLERLDRGGPGEPLAAITFDDGYRDNADTAMPILRELGAVATFFVTTGPVQGGRGLWISELWRLAPRLPAGPLAIDRDAPLTVPEGDAGRTALRRELTRRLAGLTLQEREGVLDRLALAAGVRRGEGLEDSFCRPLDLRRLRDAGMTVGAHTRGHPHLERLDSRFHDEEVLASRKDLQQLLGEPVRHFAYPNPGGTGRFPAAVREAVVRAGFASAATSSPAPLDTGCDRLRLPRLGVYAGAQERLLFGLLGDN
jgi:peptidoglycan/xylan/chitin deacetylase (PgdA/CDA1 family)